jgi:hypothetical protein
MRKLVPFLLVFIISGCTLVGAPSPETSREKYAAAESSYTTFILTVDNLITNGTLVRGTPAAQSIVASIKSTRTALDSWGRDVDNPTVQQAALIALTALQTGLVELQKQVK